MQLPSFIANLGFGIGRDLAIDLGTANTLIYAKGRGVVLNEPSIVAVIKERGYEVPYLFGEAAKMMMGKTPDNISVRRPLQDGVIADFSTAEEMIRHNVTQVIGQTLIKPRAVVCVPYGSTSVERRAIQTAVEKCGAREVYLIEEPMAAAIGAGLPVSDPIGSMVVDIGGGTAESAMISLGGVVDCKSIKMGGDKMDQAILQYVRQSHNLLIGTTTAENIKKTIGVAYPRKGEASEVALVRGRDLLSGTPKEITLTQEDVCGALSEVVASIINTIKMSLETAPPELAADVVDRGIVLTGGGACLRNLDNAISRAVNLPVFVAPRPLYCVVFGAGKVLYDYRKYSHILFKQS